MAIVVDASALLSLAFDDEGVPYGSALLESIREQGGLAPPIIWYELRNALLVNERRGRIRPERATAFLELIDELPMAIQPLPAGSGILDLARRLKLGVYDAAYLELAVREGSPLATLDAVLRMAADELDVPYWEPPGGA